MEFGREVVCDYLERNKIPKLENLKLDLSGSIDGMMDFNAELDKISKDIQKRKDNAMAMEFTKCIGELLKKNGVVPKMTEYTRNFETENTFEARYGVSIDELDFSEHDKPFEDKIKLLKEQIEKMESEKKFLRMRCMDDAIDAFDRGSYGALTIVGRRGRLEAENKLLKQRIAELEGEKSEKPTEINFNDQIKVKLTPLGVEIYYHQYDDLNESIKKNGGTPLEPRMPQIDKDGYTKFTLWHFMELYGQHIGMCNVVSPLYIELCSDEWKIRYDKEPIEKMEKSE